MHLIFYQLTIEYQLIASFNFNDKKPTGSASAPEKLKFHY